MNQSIKSLNSYVDVRGKIQMIIESGSIGSVSIIESEPGSTRANHYHPIDEHTILITEGQIEYYERPVGSKEKPNKFILNKGDLFHTKSLMEHTMYFPCNSTFICFSKLPRDSKNYEKETIKFDYSLRGI